jgi:hypothetical protein
MRCHYKLHIVSLWRIRRSKSSHDLKAWGATDDAFVRVWDQSNGHCGMIPYASSDAGKIASLPEFGSQ